MDFSGMLTDGGSFDWDLGPKQDDPVSGVVDALFSEFGGGREPAWTPEATDSRATSRSPWADIIGADSAGDVAASAASAAAGPSGWFVDSSWKPASSWIDTGGGGV